MFTGIQSLVSRWKAVLPTAYHVADVNLMITEANIKNFRYAFYDGVLAAKLTGDQLPHPKRFNEKLGLLGLAFPVGFFMAKWPGCDQSEKLISLTINRNGFSNAQIESLFRQACEAIAAARTALSESAMMQLLVQNPFPSPVTPILKIYSESVAKELASLGLGSNFPQQQLALSAQEIAHRHYVFTLTELGQSSLLVHSPATSEWDDRLYGTQA